MLVALRSIAELHRLAPAIRDAWLASDNPTIFSSPAWIVPWAATFGTGLRAFALRHGRDIVAFAAFQMRARADGSHELVPIGVGNSDYLDITAACGIDTSEFVRELLCFASREGVQQIEWPRLRVDSILASAEVPRGWTCHLMDAEPCPVLRLPASDEAFDARLSGRLRKNVRQAWHAAESLGAVRVEWARRDRVAAAMDALFLLHTAQWRARGTTGVLADPCVRRFHHHVARLADADGTLRLFELTIDGTIASVLYGFATPAGACHYIAGFNPEMAFLSPGTLAIREAIRRAIADGAPEFDFLRGQEAYKYRWGATDRRVLACQFKHAS